MSKLDNRVIWAAGLHKMFGEYCGLDNAMEVNYYAGGVTWADIEELVDNYHQIMNNEKKLSNKDESLDAWLVAAMEEEADIEWESDDAGGLFAQVFSDAESFTLADTEEKFAMVTESYRCQGYVKTHREEEKLRKILNKYKNKIERGKILKIVVDVMEVGKDV